MKILLTILLSLFLIEGFSQPYPQGNPTTNAPQSWVSYGYTRDSAHLFIARDTFNSRYPAIVMRTDGTMWKTLGAGGFWYAIGGSVDSLLFVTHTALNDTLLNYVKIQTQNPTASLSGGSNYELHSAGTFSPTLNYSAGRLAAGTNVAATSPFASITVAGVSKSTTGCSSPPCTISGTQGVTVTYNTNTSFSNVVVTTDGKSATATTNFNFYSTYYRGYVSSSSPTDADLYSAGYNFLNVSNSKATSGTLSNPSGSSYIVFAYPARFGTATITIGGLGVSYILTTRSLTNQSGYSENYNIYVSPYQTSSGVSFVVN